ncbi:MAG: hypothetical protein H7X97_12480 [Opitutaceae bacterium]|nr:hypothetical protein [Verrucomicrobiales bacterium]
MDSITQLCEEWRRLTESETAAINSRDWNALTQAQGRKSDLRFALDAAAAQGAEPREPGRRGSIRSIVEELMAMERANLNLLSAQISSAHGEQLRLAESAQNLRRLHRYSGKTASPVWQSYS